MHVTHIRLRTLTVTEAKPVDSPDTVNEGSASCVDGQCAVVIHEYADSFYRAAVGFPPVGGDPSACNVATDGASGTYERELIVRGKQLACGTYLACSHGKEACQRAHAFSNRSLPFLFNALDLPVWLSCNPHPVDSMLGDVHTPGAGVPNCEPPTTMRIDTWHNPAYDGLMRSLPDEHVGSCELRYSPANSSLVPRRAFYMLQVRAPNQSRTESGLADLPMHMHAPVLAKRTDFACLYEVRACLLRSSCYLCGSA